MSLYDNIKKKLRLVGALIDNDKVGEAHDLVWEATCVDGCTRADMLSSLLPRHIDALHDYVYVAVRP